MVWARAKIVAMPAPAAGDHQRVLDRRVVRVGEVRAVAIERPGRAADDLGIDRRQRHGEGADRALAVQAPGRGAHAPPGGLALGLPALLGRRVHLPDAGERGDRGVERAARGGPARAHEALDLERHALRELLDGELRAEVVGDRVEAAGVHDPRAAGLGRRVVGEVHAVDELGLAGEVDVVGAGRGAGGDERLAVAQVRADRGDHDLGRLGQAAQRAGVGDVGLDHLGVGRQATAQGRELLRVAAGQGPAGPGIGVGGEVLGGQRAGEAGGAEEDDVVRAVGCGHGRRP